VYQIVCQQEVGNYLRPHLEHIVTHTQDCHYLTGQRIQLTSNDTCTRAQSLTLVCRLLYVYVKSHPHVDTATCVCSYKTSLLATVRHCLQPAVLPKYMHKSLVVPIR